MSRPTAALIQQAQQAAGVLGALRDAVARARADQLISDATAESAAAALDIARYAAIHVACKLRGDDVFADVRALNAQDRADLREVEARS